MLYLSEKPARMVKSKSSSFALIGLVFIALLSTSGCTHSPVVGKSIDSMMGKRGEREARLSTAAANAVAEGKTEEALVHYSQLYSGNSRNQDIAINYAQLLRKTGNPQRAIVVLGALAMTRLDDDRSYRRRLDPIVANEYAACSIELGKFNQAKTSLSNVLQDKSAKKFHADASNLMGVLLDAQGKHKEAEGYFRTALDGWRGDATSVMNNLGLNLAEQGRFDESLNLLRRALIMEPQKQEIARNIDYVSSLRKKIIPAAPKKLKHKKKK